jgi:gliding motility-associated-like protein
MGGSPHNVQIHNGNIYVLGTTNSLDFPTTPGALQPTFGGGGTDIYVSILNSTGSSLLASTYIGGSAEDGLGIHVASSNPPFTLGAADNTSELTVDALGNCYIASHTKSTNFPTSTNAYQSNNSGDNDGVVFKLNAALTTLEFSTYLGGVGDDFSSGIMLKDNKVYVAGGASSQFFSSPNGAYPYNSLSDAYILALNSDASAILHGTYFGSSSNDHALFLDSDINGDIYVAGVSSGQISSSAGAYVSGTGTTDFSIFVSKFNNTLSVNSITALTHDILMRSFMVDDCGYSYIGGNVGTTSMDTSPNAMQSATGGVYFCVLEPDMIGLTYASFYGATGLHCELGRSKSDKNNQMLYLGTCGDGLNTLANSAVNSTTESDLGLFKVKFDLPCQMEITMVDDTICEGDCADLIASTTGTYISPVTYQWDNGITDTDSTVTVCPIITTTYQVIGTDAMGESDTTTATITVLLAPIVNLGNDTTVCVGDLILDAGNPGATYTWQDGSTNQTYTVTTTGTYFVTVDNGGCSTTDTIDVDIVNLTLDLGPDITICDPTITLDAQNPGSTYEWQDASTNQSYDVSVVGTYSVEITDPNGCTTSDTLIVSLGSITVDLGNDTLLCNGTQLALDALNPGATYQWQDMSTNQTFNVVTAGTYWVSVVYGLCNDADTLMILSTEPIAQFFPSDTVGCPPLLVSFTDESVTPHGNIVQWEWDFGDGSFSSQQYPTHEYLTSGIYSVNLTVTTDLGCTNMEGHTVQVTIYDQPTAAFNFSPNPAVLDEEVFFTDQSTNATSWFWEFNNSSTSTVQNPTFTFNEAGEITVLLIVSNEQCTDTTWLNINVNEELIYYVPNAFTPDGDEFNQTFQPIFTTGFDPYDFNMDIFNRWGEVIFTSNDTTIGWDGTYKGQIAQDGTYTWKIEFKETMSDKRHSIIGHVNILR